jgi:hypothetical protein
VAVVGALVTALLVMRSGGGSSASDTTLAPATSVAPATTSVPTTAAPATLAPTTVPATIPATTVAPTTTLPYGLPAVFPNSVPADACTAERIIADTGKTLGFDVFCNGAWSLNVPSPECGEAECESADVYRWTGERWVYRGFYYAYCVSTVSASGMPPAIARDIGAGPCGEEVDLRPEPSAGPLSMNDEGVRVQRLQQALIDRGLLFDDADGQYGPNTQAAVMDLQYFLGIEPDGMAGAEVHAALLLSYS